MPNAMTLATVDSTGMPNARIVLLKEIEENAVVFFTNYESVKGIELSLSEKRAFFCTGNHWVGRCVDAGAP